MLPGDLLELLLRRTSQSAPPAPPGQGGSPLGPDLDPQTVAEFLAYDIPFQTPPAIGFLFPSGTPRE